MVFEDVKENEFGFRLRSSPVCHLCGRQGVTLYKQLADRLFGVPGNWILKQCSDQRCGLVWLDPRPVDDDLWKAYSSYYTHTPAATPIEAEASAPMTIFGAIRKGYLRAKHGYIHVAPESYKYLSSLVWLHPLGRTYCDLSVMGLSFPRPGGRLLDVGCGEGHELLRMKQLGWEVEGVDFDAAAVENARSKGLQVRVGELRDQGYAPESFDAVFVSHVIEHVPDPVALLGECHRVLTKGGTLVIVTPNTSSVGHQRYGPDWRGLEPPRHLHLFNTRNIRHALRQSGFQRFEVRSFTRWRSAIVPLSREQRRLRLTRSPRTDAHALFYAGAGANGGEKLALLRHVIRRVELRMRPNSGEELLVRAHK